MVFPDVLKRMILVTEVYVSIFLVSAVLLGILGISINILGSRRMVNRNGYLKNIILFLFMLYLILTLVVYMIHQTTQALYFILYITMLALLLSLSIFLMDGYIGVSMKKNVVPFISYSIMVVILSLITLLIYPGKSYLLTTYFFGFHALPDITVTLYLFFIIPISLIFIYSFLYTVFRNGFERGPLYLSLGGLLLVALNGVKELGFLLLIDIILLIVSVLFILGFNGINKRMEIHS